MSLKIVKLPVRDCADIANGLRQVADCIEQGVYDPIELAWVMKLSDGDVAVGDLGVIPQPISSCYLLLGCGMRWIENKGTK